MKKSLEIGTAAGLVFGCIAIFGSFLLEGGTMGKLILLPAMMIVFGGTLATAMIGAPFGTFLKIPKFAQVALYPKKEDVPALMKQLENISRSVRRQSLLSMEKELPRLQNHFLRRLLGLAIDGMDPAALRTVAEAEMSYVTERHHANAAIFSKMGGYSPTMGIIGTVMGLISTLSNAGGDPNELIHGISTAFIATLWGVFMANLVLLPIADKLKGIHAEEAMAMEIVLEGVLSIQAGEAPGITKAKLQSMLPAPLQELR